MYARIRVYPYAETLLQRWPRVARLVTRYRRGRRWPCQVIRHPQARPLHGGLVPDRYPLGSPSLEQGLSSPYPRHLPTANDQFYGPAGWPSTDLSGRPDLAALPLESLRPL